MIKISHHTVQDKDAMKACMFIRKTVFVEEQGVSMDEEIDAFEAASTHFLVKDGEETVATARTRKLDGFIKIERVAVLAAARGQRLGKALMAHIMNHHEAQGEKAFKLNAQVDKQGFYKKFGFASFGPLFEDAGIMHIAMSKGLPA